MPYGEVLARIGDLADELLAHPDAQVRDTVGELLDWVDAFHRDGLGQLIEMVRAWRGEIFLETVARDPIAGTLLNAYGLGEDPDVESEAAEAVAGALDEVRPYAESHGGSIVVESIVDGVVRVKLLGSCDGCPSSAATLSQGVEEALRRRWTDFRRLEVVEDAPEPAPEDSVPAPVPLLQIRGHEVK
jgi:Fe-S cluster biogenesis protein NfuA